MVAITWTKESCLVIHLPPSLHLRKCEHKGSAGSPHAQVGGSGMRKGRPRRRRTAVENSRLEKAHPGTVCGVERNAAAPIAAQELRRIMFW